VAVALAFSLLAVPMCLAAGASAGTALAVALAFASVFVTGTLAVRVVVLGVRGGGAPRAVAATRLVVLLLVAGLVVTLGRSAPGGALSDVALIAAAPGLASAGAIAIHPPAPARLRTVGWTLVATSLAAAVLLCAALGK
jgi:hypothetical protein